jgi:uncharacterized membrane protein
MNRATFMAQLRTGLAGLHSSDVADILADYESHFADGLAHGRTEAEVAEALGDPARLAREMRAEVGFKRWEQDRSAGNLFGVILALLGLATLDLMLLLPILFAVIVIIFALSVCCLAFIAAGSFLLFNLLPGGWHQHLADGNIQALAGVGLASGGIGGGALLTMFANWLARMLIRYARLHFRLFDSAAQSV